MLITQLTSKMVSVKQTKHIKMHNLQLKLLDLSAQQLLLKLKLYTFLLECSGWAVDTEKLMRF